MTGNEYQNLAMRTKDSKLTDRMLGKVLNYDMIWLQHQGCIREDTNLDIAEAFDSGGGTQLELPMSVESLKELGMIHEV